MRALGTQRTSDKPFEGEEVSANFRIVGPLRFLIYFCIHPQIDWYCWQVTHTLQIHIQCVFTYSWSQPSCLGSYHMGNALEAGNLMESDDIRAWLLLKDAVVSQWA